LRTVIIYNQNFTRLTHWCHWDKKKVLYSHPSYQWDCWYDFPEMDGWCLYK